jgi:hypothetical protein
MIVSFDIAMPAEANVMKVQVDPGDLVDALEWVSTGKSNGLDNHAYIRRQDGRVVWTGEGIDEELPDDLDDDGAYVAVPDKHDLDLGNDLAIRFAEDHLPNSVDKVEDFFHERGAWSKFKSLLDSVGELENWFAYEQAALEKGLTDWAKEAGFVVVKRPSGRM